MIKNLSLLVSLTSIMLFLLTPHQTALQWAISATHPTICRLTYLFFHDNAIHLSVNVYSLLALAFLTRIKTHHFVAALIIASTLPSGLIGDTPMLGISALNFALTGMAALYSRNPYAIVACNVALVAVSMAIPNVAFMVHLYALLFGVFYGFLTVPRYE